MILRNFKNVQAAFHLFRGVSESVFGDGYLTTKNYAGTVALIQGTSTNLYFCKYTLGYNGNTGTTVTTGGIGLVPGSGDTAVTYDDYTVTSISGLTHVSCGSSYLYNSTTQKWEGTVYHVLQNTSGNSITVKEIGLFGQSNSNLGILYVREVLSSPLTVAADGYFKISMTFELDVTDPAA